MKKKEVRKTKKPQRNISEINDELRLIRIKVAEIKNNIINGKKVNPIRFLRIEKRVEEIEKEVACCRKQYSQR